MRTMRGEEEIIHGLLPDRVDDKRVHMQILWLDKGLPLVWKTSVPKCVAEGMVIQNCSRANNQVFVGIPLRSDCKMPSIHNVEELKENASTITSGYVCVGSPLGIQHLHQLSSDQASHSP